MAIADQRAIMAYDRNQAINSIYGSLHAAVGIANPYLPSAEQGALLNQLLAIQSQAEMLAEQVTRAESLLREASTYVEASASAVDTLTEQRDAIADELASVVNKIDEITKSTESYLWKATPHRIASVTGWSLEEARTLWIMLSEDNPDFLLDAAPDTVDQYRQRIRLLIDEFNEAKSGF